MNKKILIIVGSAAIFSFCSMSQKTMRVADMPHVPVDYELLGDTSAEERRVSVLGIDWSHLFSDQLAHTDSSNLNPALGIFGMPLEMAAKNGALYKGLQKIPEADKLVEPRWQVDSFNIGIYKSVNVQMWAKAIKYTRSAPVILSSKPAPVSEVAPTKKK